MFDQRQLAEVLELHEKSFALLRWVRESLKQGTISFAVVHTSADSALAAQEWIGRHLANLPPDTRPTESQIPTFARLFVAFLMTSYRLRSDSTQLVSGCGCWCSYCTYLQSGPNLEPRNPSKKDFETATELKRIYLGNLLVGRHIDHQVEIVSALLSQADLSESISLATWGAELIRRSQFASQGEAVLALWREFAWQKNSPKRKFKLKAQTIVAAERRILAAMDAVE